ncbi:hypothetical protein Tco_0706015 [Tanacetum coccineum]|uniref:Uncharacterized protein n=1 Tax=Tanacetum coccineum TaxID=301880 RepID=A0ABQ4Y6A5_9ASTR
MTPRSCLRWKPTGRIFKTIGLRWVPTGKIFAFSTNKVDSEPPNGSKEDITNQCESESSDCHAADQASVFMEMTSVHISSGLVLHQMTFDHNRSELGIQDHSNEQSSSKLVPKVVPLAVKTATSRQELELLFHHHIAMLRTTEHPSDTNVFTMKMEILLEPASNKHLYGAVVKKHKIARKAKKIKTNDKAQSQDRKAEGISQQQINEDKDQEHSSLNDKSNLTDLMKECDDDRANESGREKNCKIVTTSRYVVPTGRVKVHAGRYVVPTGKDNIIASTGRSKVIPAGKVRKRPKGNIMILPLVSVEEHIAVQRETKARSILLQSLPEDHMADFHHLDDARDI